MKLLIVFCAMIAVTTAATMCNGTPCHCAHHLTAECHGHECFCVDSNGHHHDGKRANECTDNADCVGHDCHGHHAGDTPYCHHHGSDTHGHSTCDCQ